MGWSAGTQVFSEIIRAAKKAIPDDDTRKQFYADVYPAFCELDWDTEEECFADDPIFKELYDELWGKGTVDLF